MSEKIPATWVMAKLGQVTSKPQYGWTTKAVKDSQNLKLLRTTDISAGRVNWTTVPTCYEEPNDPAKYFLERGDIVVSRAGSVGKSFLIREDVTNAVFASYLIRLKPYIKSRYLAYFMQGLSYWEQISERSSGIATPNVNATKLSSIKLSIAPLAEQTRIADKIDGLFSQLDAGEEALRRAEVLLERYRQSVLKAAVTGELTRAWREENGDTLESGEELLERILKTRRENWEGRGKYKEPVPPDTRDLPELPKGWVWATVEQVVNTFRNGLSKGAKNTPNDFPILRISAVRALNVNEKDIRYYPAQSAKEVERFYVKSGDLLFTRYNGSIRYVGVCGQYRGRPVLHPDKLIRASLMEDLSFMSDYCEIAWNTGETRRHILEHVKTTSGQQGIAGRDIKAAPFPITSTDELRVITEIVQQKLSYLGQVEIHFSNLLNHLSSLRQSILKEAFSGRLVPQDSEDEPASVLLERIKEGKRK